MQSFGEWVTKRRWTLFIDGLVVAWLVLFVVDMATTYGVLAVDDTTHATIRRALTAMVLVFLADVLLLYRWSEDSPGAFVRGNWFYVLTVFPWFRPLRLLRIGRAFRSLKLLARSRRVGSGLNKFRRMMRRAWRRVFD